MTVVGELRRVSVSLGPGERRVAALTRIDMQVEEGRVLGVVGESGAGKSSLARSFLRLVAPEDGAVLFEGSDITATPERRLRRLRSRMTMVFRDATTVLDPRLTARALIEEPLRLHTGMGSGERRAAVDALAERLRLRPAELERRPGELGIDRLQLVNVGRAIVTQPRLLVLDEPTRDLDTAAAADLLNLLAELRTGGMAIVMTGMTSPRCSRWPTGSRCSISVRSWRRGRPRTSCVMHCIPIPRRCCRPTWPPT